MSWILYVFRWVTGGMRQSLGLHALTVGTVALSLMLLGTVSVVALNLDQVIRKLEGLVGLSIYLRDEAPRAEVDRLVREIDAVASVRSTEYISRAEALRRFSLNLGELRTVLHDLEENPLPASIEVRFLRTGDPSGVARKMAARMSSEEVVEDVSFGEPWLLKLATILEVAQTGGFLLGLLFSLATLLVIANTVRLSLWVRKEEIEIMLLVGGSYAFVKSLFLIEGALIGLLGGSAASLLLYGLHELFLERAGELISSTLGLDGLHLLSLWVLSLLLAGGMVMGLLGSALSLSRWARRT